MHRFNHLLFNSLAGISFFIILQWCFSSCGHIHQSDSAEACVDSFSQHYFNWQFQRSMPFVTPTSQKWLRYVASQVQQDDVEQLRNMPQGATCKIINVDTEDGDSVAVSHVLVRGFLCMDTIGKKSHVIDEATYEIKLHYQGGKWLVNLDGLPKKVK